MSRRVTFNLKIIPQADEVCFFYLTWGEGKHDLPISQVFPAQLRRDYNFWQRQYLRFYDLPLDQTVPSSGSIPSLSLENTSATVRNLEDSMMSTFLNWLGSGETRAIERQIQTTLMETQSVNKESSKPFSGVDIFLACHDRFLQQLPWEAWIRNLLPKTSPINAIRLIRTSLDNEQRINTPPDILRSKKSRILAVIAEDKNNDKEYLINQDSSESQRSQSFLEDWKTLLTLRPEAEVKQAKWQTTDTPEVITQKVFDAITDDRGWDILFFAGHSDDRKNKSGSFQLTPEVELSINDIEEHLETARRRGLRLAIFNSCMGLAIAQSLTRLGIQSIVMRERVHNDVALAFLRPLCQELKEYRNAQEAMLKACETLRLEEKIKFPSAHLIPSFFSPPKVLPYRIKPYGWRHRARKWFPTKREIKTVGIIALLGIIPSINYNLLEHRVALQAIYRDVTRQIPKAPEGDIPPVTLVVIDQDAFDEQRISETYPISQKLIAELIKKIAPYQPRTIGINYLLNQRDNGSKELVNTMKSVAEEQNIWFTIAEESGESRQNLESYEELDFNFSLKGDTHFWLWDVNTLEDSNVENECPFGYLLSLSHTLNSNSELSDLPKLKEKIKQEINYLNLEGKEINFCESIVLFKEKLIPNQQIITDFIQKNISFRKWQSIIDFSIPDDIIYERVLASTLLKNPASIKNPGQLFIIGPGNYSEVDEEAVLSPPMAVRYWWCASFHRTRIGRPKQDCFFETRRLSNSEAHAYMFYQFLERRQVRVVPNYLMTGLFVVIGKATALALQRQPQEKRKKLIRYIFLSSVGYTLLALQLYVSIFISLPILLPPALLWTYLGPISRRNF